jgi:hypothetical protein
MAVRKLSIPLGCMLLAMAVSSLFASDIPGPLKARFVTGDPVWREIPVRDDLRSQYDKCWQTAVATILENNFDIATMDKDSGYARTTWNSGVVTLGGNWAYTVQISIKFVFLPPDPNSPTGATRGVDKIRVQAAGAIVQSKRGRVLKDFRGYDQVVLQNLFQDLQAKLATH